MGLGRAHLAEVAQLHDLDVVGAELHDSLLVLDGDQLPHSLAVLARDDLQIHISLTLYT